MTYACQKWSLSDSKLKALCISQRKMEQAFLGITLLDKKPYTWIRTKTDIRDIKDTVKDNLHRWARHLARFTDNRWALRLTHWYPCGNKRKRPRPKTRWIDSLKKFLYTYIYIYILISYEISNF